MYGAISLKMAGMSLFYGDLIRKYQWVFCIGYDGPRRDIEMT